MHEAVLTAIEEHALTPEAVDAVVLATRHEAAGAVARSFERELARVDRQIKRLMEALLAGREMPSLVPRLHGLQAKKAARLRDA